MLFQSKNFSAVASHALKDAIAIQKAVVVNADLGIFFVKVLARDVDFERHGPRGGSERLGTGSKGSHGGGLERHVKDSLNSSVPYRLCATRTGVRPMRFAPLATRKLKAKRVNA